MALSATHRRMPTPPTDDGLTHLITLACDCLFDCEQQVAARKGLHEADQSLRSHPLATSPRGQGPMPSAFAKGNGRVWRGQVETRPHPLLGCDSGTLARIRLVVSAGSDHSARLTVCRECPHHRQLILSDDLPLRASSSCYPRNRLRPEIKNR